MLKTEQILLVPQNKSLRYKLRTEARSLIGGKKIILPADLEMLNRMADELIEKTGTDPEYHDFAIVLCGNEVWRNVVAATPFNRRLLLLPKCLRNSLECRGFLDSMGLICAGCESCRMDKILKDAENLGYSTLIAEGTTIAVKLIEEGSIDAIIGVSCMHVLEQSFRHVSRSAVPALGIPLLMNGCENTQTDFEWLFEEMHNYEPDKEFQPLSISILKDIVHDYFTENSLQHYFQSHDQTEVLAKKMLMMGGQRLRPLLTVLAYESYSEKPDERIRMLMAIIVECFHKASLIHDDIEDDDDKRYGEETLHKTHGIPVAINVGDYLIGKGYRLLSEMNISPAVLAESLQIVSASHVNLASGQGEDLMLSLTDQVYTVEDLLRIFVKKTGEAMKVALLLGAINGNAHHDELKRLRTFSDWFGIAYQIRDDLNEFRETNHLDRCHHYPFLQALLNKRLSEKYNQNPLTVKELNQLDKFIADEQIDLEAQSLLNIYIDKCYNELNQLENLKMKLSLCQILRKIF